MNEMSRVVTSVDELEAPVTIPADAYVSRHYAAAEQERLWRKTWLQAGRVEEIAEVGDFITYDIGVDGVVIVRTGPDEIRAYHNVCPHRGRRLVDVPAGQHNARGKRHSFVCGYHAWTFNLQGKCTYIQHQDDWQGSLTDERTSLGKVHVDSWGGWLWINLDPEAAPLAEYRRRSWRRSSTRRGSRRASSTWFRGRAASSAPRCRPIPTSTWSRSPAPKRSASASSRMPRRR